MATIELQDATLRVQLSPLEQVGALRRSWSTPLDTVRSARWSSDLWSDARGWRFGTGLPRVILLGTMRSSGGRDFVAVYGARARGVVLEFDDRAPFRRALITADNPAIVDELLAAIGHAS